MFLFIQFNKHVVKDMFLYFVMKKTHTQVEILSRWLQIPRAVPVRPKHNHYNLNACVSLFNSKRLNTNYGEILIDATVYVNTHIYTDKRNIAIWRLHVTSLFCKKPHYLEVINTLYILLDSTMLKLYIANARNVIGKRRLWPTAQLSMPT